MLSVYCVLFLPLYSEVRVLAYSILRLCNAIPHSALHACMHLENVDHAVLRGGGGGGGFVRTPHGMGLRLLSLRPHCQSYHALCMLQAVIKSSVEVELLPFDNITDFINIMIMILAK